MSQIQQDKDKLKLYMDNHRDSLTDDKRATLADMWENAVFIPFSDMGTDEYRKRLVIQDKERNKQYGNYLRGIISFEELINQGE